MSTTTTTQTAAEKRAAARRRIYALWSLEHHGKGPFEGEAIYFAVTMVGCTYRPTILRRRGDLPLAYLVDDRLSLSVAAANMVDAWQMATFGGRVAP